MGSVTPDSVQRVPGSLILNPTDLTGSSPYGGTLLGSVRDIGFTRGVKAIPVTAEEWGGATVDVLYAGETPVFRCVFRSWDEDALAAIFPTGDAGGTTGLRSVTYQPGKDDADTTRPGRLLDSLVGGVLCFAPRAEDRHVFTVLYNAVPAIDVAHSLQMGVNHEFALAAAWYGLLDDSGRCYVQARREDITL